VRTALGSASVPEANDGTGRKPRLKLPSRVRVPKPGQDPILSPKTVAEMKAMVPVYEKLYQLENSIRQFITRVVSAKYGDEWWEKLATTDLRKTYTNNTRAEEVNAWHQRRSSNPIDYLDLDQLPVLVRAARAEFVPKFFKSEGWFQHFVEEIYQSRCVVCHINPLNQTNTANVEISLNQWVTLLKAKATEIGQLEDPTPDDDAYCNRDYTNSGRCSSRRTGSCPGAEGIRRK
jgi:Swt1-like HEPN